MTALFDTDCLLWATIRPEALTRVAAEFVEDSGNALFVSAASAWEISTKVRIGKLSMAEDLEQNFIERVQQAGYSLISIEPEIALRAGRLAGTHGDPFDRIIAAQALALDIPVLSSDSKLDSFGVSRIW